MGSLFVFSPAHADLNTGLVANYSFDDCTAKDNSGNGHDGTINGNPQCVDGSKGKALTFNGIDNSVAIQNSPMLDKISNQLTTATWIKFNDLHTTSYGNDWQSIINKSAFVSSYGLMLSFGVDANPKILRFYLNGASANADYNWNDVKEKQWYQIVTTYDGANAKIYVDGKLATSNPVSGNINVNDQDLYIGKSVNDWFGYYLNADVSDLRIYNRALSETEVKSLYNMGQLSGTVNGVQKYSAVCKNLKTGVTKKIALADGAKEWNCTAAGVKSKKGENVSVTITGFSQ